MSGVSTGSACYQDSGAWDPDKHQSGSESQDGVEAGLDPAQGPAWGTAGYNRCNALLCLPLKKCSSFKGPQLATHSTNSYLFVSMQILHKDKLDSELSDMTSLQMTSCVLILMFQDYQCAHPNVSGKPKLLIF